jgi:hypothetical protein
MENEEQHEHPHHRLIEEIAASVEARLVAKFAKWIIGNVIGLVVAIGSGIAAYYDVRADAHNAIQHDAKQDREIVEHYANARAEREALDRKLDNMTSKIDEINRFLRDHNTMTLNGLSGKGGR